MVTCTAPENGDVVVHQQVREGTRVYILHTSGADQYLIRTLDDAVAQAVWFAKRQHVRAWLTDGDCAFTLLDDFRAVLSA